MAEEIKKISFSFAKSIKKPTLIKQVPQDTKKVDYIECLDGKAIKIIGEETAKKTPLIIPLLGSETWHDRIINKIDADVFELKIKNESDTQVVKVKEEPKEISNGDITLVNKDISNIQIKTELDEEESKTLTLEEQAAKEIVEDLKSTEKKEDKLNNLTLPLKEGENLKGVEESTLEDYEKIPIDAFGLAMLRGMGWKPDKGIGKNEKIVATHISELRPKGMGLGADKMALQKQNGKIRKEEEELRLEKGTFIKIIAGKQSHAYGQIEGFDEDVGRLIVKMALSGDIISVNECTVQAVTKEEFSKNSKVLNVAKYEEFKSKENINKRRSISLESFSSDSDTERKKRKYRGDDNDRKSSKKSKSQQKDSFDSDNDNKKSIKEVRRHSSRNKGKKVKKSKKHRGEHKVSKYFESPDRRKSKKHRSRLSNKR